MWHVLRQPSVPNNCTNLTIPNITNVLVLVLEPDVTIYLFQILKGQKINFMIHLFGSFKSGEKVRYIRFETLLSSPGQPEKNQLLGGNNSDISLNCCSDVTAEKACVPSLSVQSMLLSSNVVRCRSSPLLTVFC